MATRNIVPRVNEEGNIGTSLKNWLKGWFKDLFVSGNLTDGDNSIAISAIANKSEIPSNASEVDTDASGVSVQDALDGKEDTSNKKTSLADDSDTFYASQKAVKTAVDAKSDKLITIIEKTDNHTLILSDVSKLIDVNHEDPKTITVPDNNTVAFSIGTTIAIRQKGVGTVTITPIEGSAYDEVTIQNQDGLALTGQHALATLVKVDTNTWVAFGSLGA